MNRADCNACNGTGQQKGIDGIIRKCPICEQTIVEELFEVIGYIGISALILYIIFGICYLFTISILLGCLLISLLTCVICLIFKPKKIKYYCKNCNHKIRKTDKKCKNCGVIFRGCITIKLDGKQEIE